MLQSHECNECRHAPQKSVSKFKIFIWSIFVPISITILSFTILLNLPLVASNLRIGSLQSATCDLNTKHLGFMPSADALQLDDFEPTSDAWITSPYSGPPSEAKGLAWNELQKVRGARVSKAEAQQLNLPDGLRLENGEQATITGVMHNLHCLRMIRQYLYPDYYYANVSSSYMEYLRNHSDHCIETLRESTTCIPDLTPHALYWVDEEERIHVNLKSDVKRQCVNWGSLVHWQKKREYHLEDLWVANPKTTAA